MKRQQGFTLIELIMVIVIVGILAAIALPRFVNLGYDARVAAIKSVEGSMRAANAIIYAKSSLNNKMGTGASQVIDGKDVWTEYGFAKNVESGIRPMMDLSGDFAVETLVIKHTGGGTPADCSVTYAAATSSAVSPTFTLKTDGC